MTIDIVRKGDSLAPHPRHAPEGVAFAPARVQKVAPKTQRPIKAGPR